MTAGPTTAEPGTTERGRTPTVAGDIPTRRIDFGFGDVELPRHFMAGDIVASHVVTVLSCMFPEGEDFFVRSVRNYRDQISDPELKAQVKGFIGQEAVHGREHRAFNEALGELGYPTRFLDARIRLALAVISKIAPDSLQLALTAALEHYTATLAEILLTSEMLDTDTDIPEVRELFYWHAVEESEHKSVAFDVFRTVSGNEAIRVGVMRATTVGFLASLLLGVAVSMALDPASRDLPRVRRSIARFRRNPLMRRGNVRLIRAYNTRGFHPSDHDNAELLDRWRTRLFGTGGELAGKLRSKPARVA